MNYATIKRHDVANGPGVRVSLFVSGCTHHCKGCFNAEAWDFSYGQPFTAETEEELIRALSPDYIRGLSLLGGEPFEPCNQVVLAPFLERIRKTFPGKTVWCYSGYTLEQMREHRLGDACIDILVDGEFVEEKKDLNLRFRGSSNQRILDVKKSLSADEPVLWEG